MIQYSIETDRHFAYIMEHLVYKTGDDIKYITACCVGVYPLGGQRGRDIPRRVHNRADELNSLHN